MAGSRTSSGWFDAEIGSKTLNAQTGSWRSASCNLVCHAGSLDQLLDGVKYWPRHGKAAPGGAEACEASLVGLQGGVGMSTPTMSAADRLAHELGSYVRRQPAAHDSETCRLRTMAPP